MWSAGDGGGLNLAKTEGRAKMPRELAIMACTECKRRNYTTTVNKKKQSKKLELKKFCKWCNASVLHKESK